MKEPQLEELEFNNTENNIALEIAAVLNATKNTVIEKLITSGQPYHACVLAFKDGAKEQQIITRPYIEKSIKTLEKSLDALIKRGDALQETNSKLITAMGLLQQVAENASLSMDHDTLLIPARMVEQIKTFLNDILPG